MHYKLQYKLVALSLLFASSTSLAAIAEAVLPNLAATPCAADTAPTAVCGVDSIVAQANVTKLCASLPKSECFELSEDLSGKARTFKLTHILLGTVAGSRALNDKDYSSFKKMILDYRDWAQSAAKPAARGRKRKTAPACRSTVQVSVFENGKSKADDICRDSLPAAAERDRFDSLARMMY